MTTFVYGQKFYDSLQMEADQTYNCSFDYYNVDSLNHVFFASEKVRMQIDSFSNYQVLFSHLESWCSGPNCDFQHLPLDTIVLGEKIGDEGELLQLNIPRKKYYHCSKTYNGFELIKNTEIHLEHSILNNFPTVVNNTDMYNNKWTVFSNEKYLVFRLVSVYIGNTSSGSEKYIYLKKVK